MTARLQATAVSKPMLPLFQSIPQEDENEHPNGSMCPVGAGSFGQLPVPTPKRFGGFRATSSFGRLVPSAWIALCALLAAATPVLAQQVRRPALTSPVASQTTPPTNGMYIHPSASASSDEKTIQLEFPATAETSTLKVMLNGKDVTSRFTSSACGQNICEDGVLTSTDGLRAEKNVLSATAKTQDGRLVSSRQRFEGAAANSSSPNSFAISRSSASPADSTSSNPMLPTLSNFLPPAVALTTSRTQSGYIDKFPWITVGSQQSYPDASLVCNGQPYSVVVLDRATLQEKTAAPESSPQCFPDDGSLKTYLQKSITSSDLVIVATNNNAQTPSTHSLDTTSIGGTDYATVYKNNPNAYPIRYMAIGVGGANAGQAYENYLTSQMSGAYPPFAKGTLVEDINGNYNFVSSDIEEFQVAPNDGTYNSTGQGWIKVGVPAAYVNGAYTSNLLLPPPVPGGIGGYWLVVLDRTSLHSLSNTSPVDSGCTLDLSKQPAPPNTAPYTTCGKFYGTNDSDASNATAAYLDLASDLNSLGPDQLAILTTIGNAAYGGPSQYAGTFWVAFTNDGGYSYPGTPADVAYYGKINEQPETGFFQALTNLGIPPYATMDMISGPDGTLTAYTAVTGPGLGNPLTGSSVVSTTEYSTLVGSTLEGQTGYVHGILTRDSHGYFRPGRTSQEQSFATDSANFQMAEITNQQPSDWPEFNTLLSSAQGASIAGQVQAYRYASYLLISNYYLRNTQGHQDDLHFFFDGSLNTLIDYRIFDPANLTLPSSNCSTSGSEVTCNFPPALDLASATFNTADFTSVTAQLSAEVIDLTNVLTFLSTGSDNLKDVVAAGQANTALAMIGAAATVEGSSLSPSPSAPVQVSPSNVLSMVGSVTGVVSELASLAPGVGSVVSAVVGTVSDALDIASSVTGGLTQASGAIPNPNFAFETTLGQLANNELLQGQMSVGFDTMADGILSDWNKLSQLGQLVTNTNAPGFYMPNEVSQNASLTLINMGTQRSLMLSLLPSMYQVHLWQAVGGFNSSQIGGGNSFLPAFGYAKNTGDGNWTCDDHFYGYNPPVWSSYKAFASPIPEGDSLFNNYNPSISGFADQYILTLPFTSKGTDSQRGSESDEALNDQLFGNAQGQLNFPFELIAMPNGAMDKPLLGPSSLVYMNNSGAIGFQPSQVCFGPSNWDNPLWPGPFGLDVGPGGAPGWSTGSYLATQSTGPAATTTTLTAPAAGVVGDDVTLSAKVASASGAIPTGSVTFFQNGQNIGQATLDATGAATFQTGSLALGTYSFAASYVANQTYDTSTSATATLTVYQAPPNLALSLSAASLQVSYGSTSSPVTLQLTSQYGLGGNVALSCSGLPSGLTCAFQPAQVSLKAGGNATATLTIVPGAIAQSAQVKHETETAGIGAVAGLLSIPGLLVLGTMRRRLRKRGLLVCALLAATMLLPLAGCGGSNTSGGQKTGPQTILVNATVGNLTESITLLLNVQ